MSNINSKEYWDNRFETNWIDFGGIKQTTSFMKLIIDNIPAQIELGKSSILDWGCALGQGVDYLSNTFPDSDVVGLDFSESAIKKCLDSYPMNDFYCGSLNDFDISYDVIITSNCLEHFEEPFIWINQLTKYANKYVIILVPHDDNSYLNENSEHKYKFIEDTFPNHINDFKKVYQKVICDCGDCWSGEQILVIYEK